MPNDNLRRRPLDVVTACRPADLSILPLTLAGLRNNVPFRRLYVVTARSSFGKISRQLGADVELLDENELIPGMTIDQLRTLSVPGFPRGAGWYFQQLLKLAFGFGNTEDDYFLIWDADTVPLRSLEFFDESGRMLFTIASEQHAPYFETYRKLLGEEPDVEFSFISQHMIVQKSILREMLARIETRFSGPESWAWKIMQNLQGTSTNLFSEYEMLGHYVKNHYPSRAAFRELNWLREGALRTRGKPSPQALARLAEQYDFVAFESAQMPVRRFVRHLRSWFRNR